MVTLSPVGLAAAPVANQAAFLATFKEKQETEKRFSAIEETVTGVKGSVDELKKMMSDFIKKMS